MTRNHKTMVATEPDFNVGLLTGTDSGLVVVGIDPKSGGVDSWVRLQDTHGPVPDTLSAITGGAGQHLFLQTPAGGPSLVKVQALTSRRWVR